MLRLWLCSQSYAYKGCPRISAETSWEVWLLKHEAPWGDGTMDVSLTSTSGGYHRHLIASVNKAKEDLDVQYVNGVGGIDNKGDEKSKMKTHLYKRTPILLP
eukprot:scaffold6821_cov127-Cylindrotheca_fusiformis.AAC.8